MQLLGENPRKPAKTRKKAKSGEQGKGREKNMAGGIAVGRKND